MTFLLGQDHLTSEILFELAKSPRPPVSVPPAIWERLESYRKIIDDTLDQGKTVYGINTGFGFLSNVNISFDKLTELQINLIRSHACGIGQAVSPLLVRALLILKTHHLLLGFSGISRECVEQLLAFIKYDVLPYIPEKGSVGASGDLAPLAHLALVLLGEGEVITGHGRKVTNFEFAKHSLTPYIPKAKEGLALINGTEFMTTIGACAVEEAKILIKSADVIAALSLDAVRGSLTPFDERLQSIRPHPGQIASAANVRLMFHESDQILQSHADCNKVQDPYCFRCVPQVHGASRNALMHIDQTLETELNSVTDNPIVFANGDILSGGNFHGQAMALIFDYLAIAVAEIGNISERRIEKITSPNFSDLPAFVIKSNGINSGFMIPHVVAAALVSENKILCHPASVDSIPTSADKEDHVSMGPIAARKARTINDHVSKILAIELLTACQGIDLLNPLTPSKPLQLIYKEVRHLSKALDQDRALYNDIEIVSHWVLEGGIIRTLAHNGYTLL